jgi:putative ABC transport system substrate-binding protein
MRRREFIAALGGAAAWPVTVRAQQSERVREIGVLIGQQESDPQYQQFASALARGLQSLGWSEGRNVRFTYRSTAGDTSLAETSARELIDRKPDVLVAHTTGALNAVRRQTRTIPIVFISVAEPVANGFVASLARPGGNVTGFTNLETTMGAKWLEILKEIAPGVSRVAFMFNPERSPTAEAFFRAAEAVAGRFAVAITMAPVHAPAEIETTIATLTREPGGGLIIPPDVFTTANRKLIIDLAFRHRLPAIHPFRYFATDGGLVSYGDDSVDLWRRTAAYVDRILRGTTPAELPVQQPTKFDLVINLKTARALGLTVPQTLLTLAEEVIE